MNISHRPVLLAEAVTALVGGPLIQNQNSAKQILVIDGTFGRGGHTQALLSQLPSSARMISFDKDLDAIAVAEKINDPRLQAWTQVHAAIRLISGKLQEKKSLENRINELKMEIEGVRTLASELVMGAYQSELEVHATSKLRVQIAESLNEKLINALKN